MWDLETVEIPEYDPDNYIIFLGDVIDKYLDTGECFLAEALGKLLFDRSLKMYDKGADEGDKLIPRGHPSYGGKKTYDRSIYGIDYYKYLGYRFVIQTKKLVMQANNGREGHVHTLRDMLCMIYGMSKDMVERPRAYTFA